MNQKYLVAIAVLILVSDLAASSDCSAALARRISVSAEASYYLLDREFFDLSDATGGTAALRYEIAHDIYFENSIGFFRTEGRGVGVDGLDYSLGVVSLFPVLIPYRPLARCSLGFLSVNPITVTPTSSFRPSQTTLYASIGAGISRSVGTKFFAELSAECYATPYKYRIYEFDRYEVKTRAVRFVHIVISISAVYTF